MTTTIISVVIVEIVSVCMCACILCLSVRKSQLEMMGLGASLR